MKLASCKQFWLANTHRTMSVISVLWFDSLGKEPAVEFAFSFFLIQACHIPAREKGAFPLLFPNREVRPKSSSPQCSGYLSLASHCLS